MKEDLKKKVALYIRVSTDKQVNDGYGLEDQKKRLEQFCFAKNYDIYKLYCDGESAKDTINRPQYNNMLLDMKKKKFDKILTIKLDRISRNTKDFYILLEIIKDNGCELEFIDTPLDLNGSDGKLMAGILSVFSEFERNLIVDRTNRGVNEAVHNGHFGGKPPLGYTNKDINGNKVKTWRINEEEAEIVKEIFDLCLNGKTYAQISNIMNKKYSNLIGCYRIDKETGERIPIYRNWKDSSISVILNNKRYIGIHEHRKTSKNKETIEIIGKIPPIISEEVYNQCQENIKRNMRNYYRNKKYLFMQKLVCPKCGRILACNGTKKNGIRDYLYYKCKDCDVYIREEWVEKTLIEHLVNLLEMYLVLENDCYPIDTGLAEDFNNCRIDNKIRFSIDSSIADEKSKIVNYECLYPIWELTSYETKCDFIYDYIDKIEIKKVINKGKKDPAIEFVDLQLRPNKLENFFKMKEKCMIDSNINYGNFRYSLSEFNSEKEAIKYIEILKKKFDFNIIDLSVDNQYYYSDNLFKIINVNPKRIIEKSKTFFLELRN